ncbi:MAG: hypothetical protein HY897_13350 [Deltaproteobacteria bacterium]|nr:hypothetical protein [Deltaproteobacteria bacterium]
MGSTMRRFSIAACLMALAPAVGLGAETIPAPASKAASKSSEAAEAAGGEESGFRTTVIGQKEIRETDPVGSYGQPVWTAKRRFPTTRVYVIPDGAVTIEYWLTTSGAMDGDSQPSYESQFEFELGLGKRLQFDLYFVFGQDGYAAPLALTKEKIELRYALADWGSLWGNPAIYLEWIRRHEKPQKGEVKLLLGDEITPVWFWGFNIVFEREFGGESANEYALSAGLSRVVVQNRVNIGVEVKVVAEDVSGARFDFVEKRFLAGPSLQVKPVRGVFVNLVPMAGVVMADETEGIYTVYLIIGKDL